MTVVTVFWNVHTAGLVMITVEKNTNTTAARTRNCTNEHIAVNSKMPYLAFTHCKMKKSAQRDANTARWL